MKVPIHIQITIGEYYQHYKGGLYKVIQIAKFEETFEWMVIYENVTNGDMWVRPAKEWNQWLPEHKRMRYTFMAVPEKEQKS